MSLSPKGVVIAAPSSGSGKTVLTLGLLRHLAKSGVAVASGKVGPDYIDPAFHSVASGRPCLNLDPWAMRPGVLASGLAILKKDADLLVCEGVMGLFDGALVANAQALDPCPKDGSTAHLASLLDLPVVLVVDARAQAGSAAAVVRGFCTHRSDIAIGGVIFNRVGGENHARILRRSMEAALPDVPVLGCLPVQEDLSLPERHLGLVQAMEHPKLEAFLDKAAALVGAHVDVNALQALAKGGRTGREAQNVALPPLGNRIAVAFDQAFAFRYELILSGWRQQGAEIVPFSPLNDEAPDENADAVYLPGGYPELHAGKLARNETFLEGLRTSARTGARIFGECGGYMTLGQGLVDAQGVRHQMAGLLPLETSFEKRRLHLGYRRATLCCDMPFGRKGSVLKGHEFHYASILSEQGKALFECQNAAGDPLGPAGLVKGNVFASFIHLIDREA